MLDIEARNVIESLDNLVNQGKNKQVINLLVEYLVDDLYWTNNNIGGVDRESLIQAVNMLKRSSKND